MALNNRSPLKSVPLRMPGESLDNRLQDYVLENAFYPFFISGCAILFAILEWVHYFRNLPPRPYEVTVVTAGIVAWSVWSIFRARRVVRQLRLGRDGERWVAQYLEGLRALDFYVYHDVPNGNSNIDHVLIGPRGVYAIETKTISKPQRGECRITVSEDGVAANGQTLDRNPVIQARAQAGWLKSFFGDVGFKPQVWPVVLIPGWFVERFDFKTLGLWVLEPKALEKFIENEPEIIPKEEVRAMALALASYIRSQSKL